MNLASIMMNIRPGIRRLLAASTVLAVLALLWPRQVFQVSPPAVREGADQAHSARPSDLPAASPAIAASLSLPDRLPDLRFGKATFDPFVGAPAMTVATTPAPQTAPAPVAYSPAPAMPTTPAVDYRYLGQMIGPAGQRLIYLAKGEQLIPVQVGTRLDDGFVVEAMEANGLKLHYPPSGSRALIPMPGPPDNSVR